MSAGDHFDVLDIYGPQRPGPAWALCSNCGMKCDDDRRIQFGMGPSHAHYSWACAGCGRHVRVESSTMEFILAQLAESGAGETTT